MLVILWLQPVTAFSQQDQTTGQLPPENSGSKATTETVFKDWRVICPRQENGSLAACVMAPLISSGDKTQRSIRMAIELRAKSKTEQALVIFSTPQDALLPAGVVFQVDGRRGVKVPFHSCSNMGCLAPFNPDKSLMNGFLRGLDMKVASLALDGTQRTAEFSLRGFTAAIRELRGSVRRKQASEGK